MGYLSTLEDGSEGGRLQVKERRLLPKQLIDVFILAMAIMLWPAGAKIVHAAGESDLEYQGFKYSISDGQVTITGYTPKSIDDVEITVPSVIDGKPVTGIGDDAFKFVPLRHITLPKGIKTIGKSA